MVNLKILIWTKEFTGEPNMHFKQKKDGSCILYFEDKEIDIIKEKKQIYFTAESLKHFGNVLMKMVINFNQNFPDEVKELSTNENSKVIGELNIEDKDNK